MNHLIETLKKDRKPVHGRCLGYDFSDAEKKFLKLPMCSRVESYNGDKSIDGDGNITSFCSTFTDPVNKWTHGKRCPLSDHFRPDLVEKDEKKQRVGQQKQKKK